MANPHTIKPTSLKAVYDIGKVIMENKQLARLEAVLEDYLLEHKPISSAMGVRVDLASSTQIVLKALYYLLKLIK